MAEQKEEQTKKPGKKKLFVMLAIGLLSFGGAFAAAWFTKAPADAEAAERQVSQEIIEQSQEPVQEVPQVMMSISERQLQELTAAVRERISEYNSKLESLKSFESRLEIAREELKKEIEELNRLQTDAAGKIAYLKEQQDKILKSRVEILEKEKQNLMSIAATYDKMDAASAGKILASMCQSKNVSPVDMSSSFDDAVKILYFMTERTGAKVLAELAEIEPELAAVLSQKLKQVAERN